MMMMTKKYDRRCSDCKHKTKDCDLWKDKKETTLSGWDKNRIAVSCSDYKEEKENGI